ncbi:Hypothetical predicted protein [Cloeon dipterum]|uniref:Peptidase A2 domain-containing protein n=1 Tax=Cloeon dipterum TaxID=197152 RepID=A0A8S1DQP0_9INSE|nr:Hypothetical predicted protein [Cloeon dipterum]
MSFSSPALGDLRWAWALKMRIKPWLSQQYSQPSSSGSSHQAEGFSVYGNTYSGVCRGRTSPVDVTFLVDSGAIVSLMSLALVQELRAAIVPFQHNVGTSNGAPIKVVGQVDVFIDWEKKGFYHTFVVFDVVGVTFESLIGSDFMCEHQANIITSRKILQFPWDAPISAREGHHESILALKTSAIVCRRFVDRVRRLITALSPAKPWSLISFAGIMLHREFTFTEDIDYGQGQHDKIGQAGKQMNAVRAAAAVAAADEEDSGHEGDSPKFELDMEKMSLGKLTQSQLRTLSAIYGRALLIIVRYNFDSHALRL